jgi:RNA polymerase sigma-70 factor (ECF subfamily)
MSPRQSQPKREFHTTHWSAVLAAGGTDSAAKSALTRLCTAYWDPLYAFLRRSGYSIEDAEDLTQGFFAHLLERRSLATLTQDKGRFRSFLLASLKNYAGHVRERAHAQKRGGGLPLLPLDTTEAEDHYRNEPADRLTPDRMIDRRWARTVLERALDRVQRDFAERENRELFDVLRPALLSDHPTMTYAEIAARFHTTEGAIKVIVHRLRRGYRSALRSEIGETVGSFEDVDAELRHLLAALTDE